MKQSTIRTIIRLDHLRIKIHKDTNPLKTKIQIQEYLGDSTSVKYAKLNLSMSKKNSIHVIANTQFVIVAIITKWRTKDANVQIAENIMKLLV